MLLYFFATYAVLVISFNLPFLIQQYKLTSSASGVMISLFFLAIMLPGLAVDRVIALLGKKTMFVSLLLIGAGLLLLYLMKSEFFVALGCFATGLGYGVIQPVVYNRRSSRLPANGRRWRWLSSCRSTIWRSCFVRSSSICSPVCFGPLRRPISRFC